MAEAGEKTSLRALARLLTVGETAVRKAVTSGRLSASVGHTATGRPYITDVALAQQEWARNAGKPAKGGDDRALVDVQRGVGIQRERALKLKNDQTTRKLTDTSAAVREAFAAARVLRERVMNVTDRVSDEFAVETDAKKIRARLDAELRLALEAAANELVS